MNLKLILIVFTSLGVVHFNTAAAAGAADGITFTASQHEAIQKWTEVGVKVPDNTVAKSLETAVAVIDAIGAAIPKAAPFASLLSSILSLFIHHSSELQVVLDELKQLNTKLDRINDRLDEVIRKIETTHIIVDYKSRLDDVYRLKHIYDRFTLNPTNITRDDLRRECGQNKMLAFAHWLEGEVAGLTHLPLQQLMVADFDLANLNYWSNQVAAMLANAVFLHTSCVGVAPYNETIISETLNGKGGHGGGGDLDTLQHIVRKVKQGLYQNMKYIKRAFFAHAKQEVEDFMRDHEHLDNAEFAQALYGKLSAKYPWRRWQVVSWNGNTLGSDKQTLTGNSEGFWWWLRVHNRCLAVSSVLSDGAVYHIDEQIQQCASHAPHISGHLADGVYNYLRDCITSHGTPLTGLVVVNFGHGVRGVGGVAFQNVRFNGNHDLSVFGMPYDASTVYVHEGDKGEVCSASGRRCADANQHCCGGGCCADDSL